MVVNPAYKGIKLPVDQWPLLSTYRADGVLRLGQTTTTVCTTYPVPFQPLIAAPLATLEDISEAMQFDMPNSTTTCSQPNGRSPRGEAGRPSVARSRSYRFMIGITPLADDQRYGLQTAALQTTSGTFVAPNDASLRGGNCPAEAGPDDRHLADSLRRVPDVGRRCRPIRAPWSCTPQCRHGLAGDRRPGLCRLARVCRRRRPDPGLGRRAAPARLSPLDAADGLGGLAATRGRGTTSRHRTARSLRPRDAGPGDVRLADDERSHPRGF